MKMAPATRGRIARKHPCIAGAISPSWAVPVSSITDILT